MTAEPRRRSSWAVWIAGAVVLAASFTFGGIVEYARRDIGQLPYLAASGVQPRFKGARLSTEQWLVLAFQWREPDGTVTIYWGLRSFGHVSARRYGSLWD